MSIDNNAENFWYVNIYFTPGLYPHLNLQLTLEGNFTGAFFISASASYMYIPMAVCIPISMSSLQQMKK